MDKEVLKEANDAENAIKLSNKKTHMKKRQFIDEIKNGYGAAIKDDIVGREPKKGFFGYIENLLKMF